MNHNITLFLNMLQSKLTSMNFLYDVQSIVCLLQGRLTNLWASKFTCPIACKGKGLGLDYFVTITWCIYLHCLFIRIITREISVYQPVHIHHVSIQSIWKSTINSLYSDTATETFTVIDSLNQNAYWRTGAVLVIKKNQQNFYIQTQQ